MTDTSPFNNPDHNCFYFACEYCIYVILLLIVSSVQEVASNFRCHASLSASYHDGATTTDSCIQKTMSTTICYTCHRHNIQNKIASSSLLLSEKAFGMHAHGRYYLARSYDNYFEHGSSLILVKRINLLLVLLQ